MPESKLDPSVEHMLSGDIGLRSESVKMLDVVDAFEVARYSPLGRLGDLPPVWPPDKCVLEVLKVRVWHCGRAILRLPRRVRSLCV
jgi:hypothetical protein